MNSGISTVILNEKPASSEELKKIVTALCDKKIIVEKGGFLFSSCIRGNTLYIGILPYFTNGERNYHYNIELPEDKSILTGFINSNASLEIFFKLTIEEQKKKLTSDQIFRFRENYIKLCRFFLENGFSGSFKFSPIAIAPLVELGIFPEAPDTVEKFAKLKVATQ